MTGKKLYFILLGVIILLFAGLVGGAYGANKLLTRQAGQLTALKAKSMAQTQQQQSLQKAKKDIQKYSSLEKITRAVVPEEKNQAAAVREIVNIADANDVTLTGITFPASTLGTTASGQPITGTAATPSPAAPTAGNKKGAGLSQLVPVKNIPGVYQLVITIQNDPNHAVQYDRFVSFLHGLEQDRHTAQVSKISIQPTVANRNYLVFNLSLVEYIKP